MSIQNEFTWLIIKEPANICRPPPCHILRANIKKQFGSNLAPWIRCVCFNRRSQRQTRDPSQPAVQHQLIVACASPQVYVRPATAPRFSAMAARPHCTRQLQQSSVPVQRLTNSNKANSIHLTRAAENIPVRFPCPAMGVGAAAAPVQDLGTTSSQASAQEPPSPASPRHPAPHGRCCRPRPVHGWAHSKGARSSNGPVSPSKGSPSAEKAEGLGLLS